MLFRFSVWSVICYGPHFVAVFIIFRWVNREVWVSAETNHVAVTGSLQKWARVVLKGFRDQMTTPHFQTTMVVV